MNKSILLTGIVLLISFLSFGQSKEHVPIDENNIVKEEVHRFVGYEDVLYKYVSLIYDTSINNNENSSFLDIGFLLLIFIPIFLLIKFRTRTKLMWCTIFFMLGLWIISSANSVIYTSLQNRITGSEENIGSLISQINFQTNPNIYLTAWLYQLALWLFQPIDYIGSYITDSEDSTTYTILSIAFLASLFAWHKIKLFKSPILNSLFLFFFVYGTYWILFGAGIIWYGYIILILGYVISLALLESFPRDQLSSVVKYSFYSLGCVWILMSLIGRISNIVPNSTVGSLGKLMYGDYFYQYQCGVLNKDEVTNIMFPGIQSALNSINSNDELIYRVGTQLTYFIQNNESRLLHDNQLGVFYWLNKSFPKEEIADALKANGYKYILVDLNTHVIDRTPDKTLSNKTLDFFTFLNGNDDLQLLATNRVLEYEENQKKKYIYGVFGNNVAYKGTYAVYEVL